MISSHLGVVIAFTTVQFVFVFYRGLNISQRISTALYFFGALSDVFLSIMLWFILEDEKPPAVLVDGN